MKRTRTPKLVVVTGAGSGIGRATALRFAANTGAMVVAADINADAALGTVRLIHQSGGQAAAFGVDVSDAAAMESFAAEVQRDFGVADVVVNNAGVISAGAFLDHSAEDWDRMMAVNVYGVIHGSRLFAQQMRLRGEGGEIINIASAGGFIPVPLSSPYCTTKAAVLMLSECLRIELARDRIGVTAICPGIIDTGLLVNAPFPGMDPEEAERLRSLALGASHRVASDPDVVAKAVLRASRTNPAIRPVRPEAWAGFALSRLSPATLRFVTRYAVIDRTRKLVDTVVPKRLQNRLIQEGAR